jgi:ubiquinone biosynthesis protein COQ9
MIDLSTPKGRIVEAAMRLAATKPWRDVTMAEIAQNADMGLADLAKEFYGKLGIVAGFQKLVDEEVLRRARVVLGKDESARDRVFDVIMTRFDVLSPYRVALRSILSDGGVLPLPSTLGKMMRSQHWMLVAAGVPADGPAGRVREAGLLAVYGRAFREWLEDDDPGHAKTMAVLDRRLRSGERWMQMFEDMHDRAGKVARIFAPGSRRRRDREADAPGTASAATTPHDAPSAGRVGP